LAPGIPTGERRAGWQRDATFTTAANREMAELHDRMPVILEPGGWPAWLGETEGDPASLLHPAPNGTLRTWGVDRRVGSPRNNGAELIKPIKIAILRPRRQRVARGGAGPGAPARGGPKEGVYAQLWADGELVADVAQSSRTSGGSQ
jgi:hypothetical protein